MKKKLFECVNGNQFKLVDKLNESVDYMIQGVEGKSATLRSSVATLILQEPGDPPGAMISEKCFVGGHNMDPRRIIADIERNVQKKFGKTIQEFKAIAQKPYPVDTKDRDVKVYNQLAGWGLPDIKTVMKIIKLPTYFHEFVVELVEFYELAQSAAQAGKMIVHSDDFEPEGEEGGQDAGDTQSFPAH